MVKTLIRICFFLIIGFYCSAQGQYVGSITGNHSVYYTKRLITTNDVGYIIEEVFYYLSTNNGSQRELLITKFDACNEIVWSKVLSSLGIPDINDGLSLIQTKDNGFLLTYSCVRNTIPDSILVNNSAFQLITKLDSSGNTLWTKKLNVIHLPKNNGWTPLVFSSANTTDSGYVLYGAAQYVS